MGSYLCAQNLGHHLGSRDRAHLARWSRAFLEARNEHHCCEGVTRSGSPCRQPRLRGQALCRHHLRDPKLRGQADAEREARHRRTLERGGIPIHMERARRGLAALARRRLHQSWKIDRRLPGCTISFASPADRERTRLWLIQNTGVDPDAPLAATGHPPTPRCLDRLLWAGWRIVRTGGEASEEMLTNARYRVVSAIRDDERFWRRWEEAGHDEEVA